MAYSNKSSNLWPRRLPASRPWYYSMEFRQDGVWFDPPLGSPELAHALSYHFPPPEPTLERRTHVDRYWEDVDRYLQDVERHSSPGVSSFYHKRPRSPQDTTEVYEDLEFSTSQPDSSCPIAATTINGSLSHTVQPISFVMYEPSSDFPSSSSTSAELQVQTSGTSRHRRKLEEDEAKRVADTRGHACAKHRRRHQTCDPADCPDHGKSKVKNRKNQQREDLQSLAPSTAIVESGNSNNIVQQNHQSQGCLVPELLYSDVGAGTTNGSAYMFAIPGSQSEIHCDFQHDLPNPTLMGYPIPPPIPIQGENFHQSLSYASNMGHISMGEIQGNTSNYSSPWSSEVPQFMSTWQRNNSTTYPAVTLMPESEISIATNIQSLSATAAISSEQMELGGQSQQYFSGSWDHDLDYDPLHDGFPNDCRSMNVHSSEDYEQAEKPHNISLSYLLESLKDTAKTHILKLDQDFTSSESRSPTEQASRAVAPYPRSTKHYSSAQINEESLYDKDSPIRKRQQTISDDEYLFSSKQIGSRRSRSVAPLQDLEQDNAVTHDKAQNFLGPLDTEIPPAKNSSSRSRSAAPPSSSRTKNAVDKTRDSLAPSKRSSSPHRNSSHRSRSVVPGKTRQTSPSPVQSAPSSHQSISSRGVSRSSSTEQHHRISRSQQKEARKERHSSSQRRSSSRRPAHRDVSRVKSTISRNESRSRSPPHRKTEHGNEGVDVVSKLANILDRTLEIFD